MIKNKLVAPSQNKRGRDEDNYCSNLARSKRAKAHLILIFSTNTDRESVAGGAGPGPPPAPPPPRKRQGRRASVFAGARCAGTYSMGQPRRVSTQSSRRQGLWRRPGRRLRKMAGPGPGRQPARGVRILAPVRHRVETGPGREASGGRRVTRRCFRGGRPSQGKRAGCGRRIAHLCPSHSTRPSPLVTQDNFGLIARPWRRRRIFQVSALSSSVCRCPAYIAGDG